MIAAFDQKHLDLQKPHTKGIQGASPFLPSSNPRLTIPSSRSMLPLFVAGCWLPLDHQPTPTLAVSGPQYSPGDAALSSRKPCRDEQRAARVLLFMPHESEPHASPARENLCIDHVAPTTPWALLLPMGSWIPMTNYATLTDLDLVEAARQHNNRRAFAELLQRYQRPLYNYILRMVRQPAVAEELFQETFLRIYNNLEHFRGGASFSPWAYRIAHNICIDALRSQRNRHNVSLEAEQGDTNQTLADRLEGHSPNPEDELYRQQLGARIQEAVEKLPPAIRAVFVLYQYQHLPYEQIAETLDIPLGTVKSRMHTALQKLSHYLRQLSPTGDNPRDLKDSDTLDDSSSSSSSKNPKSQKNTHNKPSL